MLATLEGLGSGGVVAVRKRSPENTINDIIVIPGLRAPPLHPPSAPPPLPTVIARPTKRPATTVKNLSCPTSVPLSCDGSSVRASQVQRPYHTPVSGLITSSQERDQASLFGLQPSSYRLVDPSRRNQRSISPWRIAIGQCQAMQCGVGRMCISCGQRQKLRCCMTLSMIFFRS